MADKSIEQLTAAENVYATDLFVLQQSGTAKKLTGQVLENWLVSFADGHGGIQSIRKVSTRGLVDTYRITMADTTFFDFTVTNGRSINSIEKTSTSGLVDTYTIEYNDGTTGIFTVTNGAKGDKGDNAYVWIKYASQEPTESSHSMGDIPDNWIGIYAGNASAAPSDWKQYKWFKTKGEKGDTGSPATLYSQSVTYQVGDSGSIIPSGSWGSSVPVVPQAKYLWTRTEVRFNTGDPVVSYSVTRMGIDGSGSVSSVNNVSPDETGNVTLTASDVGALPSSGGDMTGAINMNGQPVSGLNPPTEDTQAANKGYVDGAVRKAAPRNLLDNSDFTNPVNQRGFVSGREVPAYSYFLDRWVTNGETAYPTFGPEGIGGISNDISQRLDLTAYIGKKMTLALYSDYETVISFTTGTITSNDGWALIGASPNWECSIISIAANRWSCNFRVPCKYAALYEGEFTADTMPRYSPKGYGPELAECQRYFQVFRTESLCPDYCLDFRPTMRMTDTGMVSKYTDTIDGVVCCFATAEL